MIQKRQTFVAGCLAALSACGLSACQKTKEPVAEPRSAAVEPKAPLASTPRQTEPQFGPHHSPVTVKLLGPEQVQAGQDIEVTAEVEQLVGWHAEVRLSLELPAGARLVSGETSELLPNGNGTLVRRFVVHLDRVPETDILAVASTQSQSFGARAKSSYRFGRPEPRFAEPERAPKPLTVGGKDVGRPIQLRPSP
jgi:hypothetical protein